MNGQVPCIRSALRPGRLYCLLALCLGTACAVPEKRASPQVEPYHIDSFFYLRARALLRECYAHDTPQLTLRQVAEALDRCDFEAKCEAEVCWRIHGDVGEPEQEKSPAKDVYRWPDLEPGKPRLGPPRHYRPRAVQDSEEPIPSWPERQKCETKCWKEHCECYTDCKGKAPDDFGKSLCAKRCEKQHHQCDKKCGEGNT